MALGKTISLNNTGVDLTYWRATGVDVDMITGVARITVSGYIDLAARNAGKKPVQQKVIVWRASQNPITPQSLLDGTVFTKVYNKLKEANVSPFEPQNPFIGATDV